MARRTRFAVLLAAALITTAARDVGPRIAVIVNPARSDALDPADAASIYLRQRRFWQDGTPILPLNRESGSELRKAFTRLVLRLSDAELAAYWNQQYFQGIFVAAELRAVGYVEAEVVDSSVRVACLLE
jgi:hypothetical protein